MTTATRKTLDEYLTLQYPLQVVADPDGGYVVLFPDLPGCMTQVETLAEVPAMVDDARELWIKSAYGRGVDIPLPSYPEEYSGKFNLRIPRSLHRGLADEAKEQGMSLNQYVATLLAKRDAQSSVARRLERLESLFVDRFEHLEHELASLNARIPYRVAEMPRERKSAAVGITDPGADI